MSKIDLNKVSLVKIDPEYDGVRIDRFIKENVKNASFGLIQKKFRKGEIKLNNKKCNISDRLNVGDMVRIPPFKNLENPINDDKKINNLYVEKLKKIILFEEKDFLIINKPENIACQGGKNVGENIDSYMQSYNVKYNANLKLVHRIDKETSGILVVAKSRQAAVKLTEDFRNRKIKKIYLAFSQGIPKFGKGIIEKDIFSSLKNKYQQAKSVYELKGSIGDKESMFFLYPHTGRKHQLRIHLKDIGCPIIGDEKYGTKSDRMYLHAFGIQINGKLYFTQIPQKFEYRVENMGITKGELIKWGKEWISL